MDVAKGTTGRSIVMHSPIDTKKYGFYELVSYLGSQDIVPESALNERNATGKMLVLFTSNPSFAFQPGDVDQLKVLPDSIKNRLPLYSMAVNFLGLHGANSPLPAFYTEEMLGKGEDESASRQFLDLFNHRLIELLYQIWRKYQVFQRSQLDKGRADSYLDQILGIQYLPAAMKRSLRQVAGLRSGGGVSSHHLAKAFSLLMEKQRVEIIENVVDKVSLGRENLNALGVANTGLGKNAFLGENIVSYNSKFIVRVYLDRKQDIEQSIKSIKHWITVFGVSYLSCVVEFILPQYLIEKAQLGNAESRLGFLALGKTNNNEKITRVL